MVSSTLVSSGSSCNLPSMEGRSVVSTNIKDVASYPPKVPSPRLVAMQQRMQASGISESVARRICYAKRSSTSNLYDYRWKSWLDRCIEREVDPFNPSVNIFGEFLISLHDKNFSPATVKGYRSAISTTLKQVYERNGKNLFWSIKNSGEILNKLKSRGFLASGLSTYDFCTLYTTLPHNLIKEKLTELIEQTFNKEGSLYLACNDKNAFFTSEQPKRYKLWSCQKMCDALHYLLDDIFIRFGSKLYRQIVGIPMGTNCAPLVADLFLFCYERDFMLSLSDNNQSDIIEAFNSTSRYLDD